MKRLSSVVLLLVAGLAVSPAARAAELVNGIAALVGSDVITYEQVDRFVLRGIQTLRTQYANQPEIFRRKAAELRGEGVQSLIERRLILQEFKDMKANIPETVIDNYVDRRIKERFGGDRNTLTKTLQEQGITSESFRRDRREEFIEAIMRRRNVPNDVLISPGRIEKYYRENEAKFRINDQVKLRMIVIDKSRNPVDALRLGREIIAKLEDGTDFAEMATVYSDGSQARDGGSWGWVERKVLREDLAEIAFKLGAGQRSELIEKPEAVYLMLVEEVRTAHVRPIAETREEIEQTLVSDEQGRLEKAWIERLKKKSFVRIFL